MRNHRRPGTAPGLTQVVTPGVEMAHLGLALLRLQPGERYRSQTEGAEACLVLLGGTCTVSGPGFHFVSIGERESVFGGRATAVYLPAGQTFEVLALTALEIAVALSPAEAGGEPHLIRPGDVIVNERGRPGFRRQVHDILDGRTPAKRLVIGETFNEAGEWSSYPPHKHDQAIPEQEAVMEELYLFKVSPEQGFGVQVLYTSDGSLEEAYMLRDGDVTLLPRGYHPVSAAPGYRLYYLWIMAGEGRSLLPNDDPVHAWVKQG